MFKEKLRRLFEALLTLILFTTQNIIYQDGAISVMFIPLLFYLAASIKNPYLEWDLYLLFFAKDFIVGRVIALFGFVIFLLAAIQFLKARARGLDFVQTGLYSVVRHPQYLGIVIATIGLNIMILTLERQPLPILSWFIQVVGYIILAKYEESHLEKRYGGSFRQYKQAVPFIFPVKAPSKIPETLFTILIAIIISIIFLTFPFDLIRIH